MAKLRMPRVRLSTTLETKSKSAECVERTMKRPVIQSAFFTSWLPLCQSIIKSQTYLALASDALEMSSALLRLNTSLATSRCLLSSVCTEMRILPLRIFAS